MTRTLRRPRAILAPVLLAAAVSSCGVISNTSDAFSVDGRSFSREDLNGLVRALSEAHQVTVLNNQADGKDIRSVATVLIQYRSGVRVLDKLGTPVTDADRKAIQAEVASQLPTTMSKEVVDLLVDINATGRALDKVPKPTETQLESMYSTLPASTGVLCVRQLTVKTREQAVAAVDEINSGKSFASVAARVSTDKITRTAGGAVTGSSGEPCIAVALASVDKSLGTTVTRELLRTGAEGTTGIIQDAKGWHVAMHRPFAEIKTALTAVFASQPGRAMTAGVLATADITVNPVYGTWNPVTTKVE